MLGSTAVLRCNYFLLVLGTVDCMRVLLLSGDMDQSWHPRYCHVSKHLFKISKNNLTLFI